MDRSPPRIAVDMGGIVYCRCAFAEVLPREVKEEVLRGLRAANVPFVAVPDLCELAARKDPKLGELLRNAPLKIAACHPRAVKWLIHAAGAGLPEEGDGVQVVNLRELSAEEALAKLLPGDASSGAETHAPVPETSPLPETPPAWKPWFPVIDYDRCTNCLQCLSFCLFNVYGVDAGHRIQVEHPENCKTNCPACSRVCPELAILFPKHSAGPINGAPVSGRDLGRETVKVDISALLGGDLHGTLRARSASARERFSLERSPDQALQERRKCLAKLQGEGWIPPEVLAGIDLDSLPGPDEIRRRAQEAAERAEAARRKAERDGNPIGMD